MAIPKPPALPHRLIAATNGLTCQLKRTTNYLNTVFPALLAEEQNRRESIAFLFESIVLMLCTFLEDYFKTLVSVAAFQYPGKVRSYMSTNFSRKDKVDYELMDATQLSNTISQRFKLTSKNIDLFIAAFEELFQLEPFPDPTTKSYLEDLVTIRHLLTHEGGWLNP